MFTMLRKAAAWSLIGITLLLLAGCTLFTNLPDSQSQQTAEIGSTGPSQKDLFEALPVCPPAEPGLGSWIGRCQAQIILENQRLLTADLAPNGYNPAQIRHAYGFDEISANAAGHTIAIVDAFDNPTIESDLAAFKSTFGITGCNLTKVDQNGGTTFPAIDAGWALEIAIDVEWVCAVAPGANILLVEAKDNMPNNFFAAVDYAAQHARVVATSFSGNEFENEGSYDGHFNVPGVTFLASSGDTGAGVQWPASSPLVIGVGGTSLPLDSAGNLVGAETAWSGSGGGISAYEPEPDYQLSLPIPNTGGKRSVPDVSFDADPKTGAAVYISTPFQGQAGWVVAGGTSLSVMIAAGWVAMTENTLATIYAAAKASYASNFRDIISGSSAHQGYDFVTGLGSPRVSASAPVQSPTVLSLTVTTAGTGQGTVSSAPPGITCGSICSATFASGTVITLTATPASGSTFNNWSGCDSASGNQCTVSSNANRMVSATFVLQPTPQPQPAPPPGGGGSSSSLMGLAVLAAGTGQGTVSSVPPGITCGSICSATFASGTLVTLAATPASGSTFAGWGGCDLASGAQCTVSSNTNRMVSATFTLQPTPPPAPPPGGGDSSSLTLHAGWNMISSPLGLVPLSSLAGDCSFINGPWWWDGSQYQRASIIEPAKGYWVKAANPCTMQASGSNEPESLSLVDGWNMISSSGSWNQMNTGGCTLLAGPFWYDGTQYESLGPDTLLNGFLGYWVKVGGSCSVGGQSLHSSGVDSPLPPGPPAE